METIGVAVNKKIKVALACGLFAVAGSANAYFTMNDLNKMGEPDSEGRTMWLLATMDGIDMGLSLSHNDAAAESLGACARNITVKQWIAIFNTYAAKHPERWDTSADQLLVDAVKDTCQTRGTPWATN
jgi:hypothetical protein